MKQHWSIDEVQNIWQLASRLHDGQKYDHLEKMLDSLKRIKQQPKEIWAVKLADRIVNLYEPPYYWNNDKKKKYKEESEIILKELGDGNQYLADRLRNKIASYDRFITGS
jgi:(p)ppGpp synthase/HD superfamily hydrolase